MSQATTLRNPIAARRERLRPPPRWLTAGAVYAVVVVLGALTAYWAMFSQFAPIQDEGFFDYTLQLFVSGHPLYNAVWSAYGPFYYEVFGGLFALIGQAVTTDVGREIQLFIWLAASLGLGLTAHRLTGRLSIGVATLATSFALMTSLINEPMHPEALVCALLTASVIVVVFGLPRRPQLSLFTLGALAAALLLTKINVGGYEIISIAFAAVMAGPALVRYAVLRWGVIAAFVLVGPAVMASQLNTAPVRVYALLAVLSALALTFVSAPIRIEAPRSDESSRWPQWLIAGFGTCLVVVLAIVFALGTSPGVLFNQIVVVPSRQPSIFSAPVVLGANVVWWSLAATGLAWTLRRIGRVTPGAAIAAPSLLDGLLRVLVGVAILLSLANEFPFVISPNAPFALAMPLAWVAALPSRRDGPGLIPRLVKLLIPSLAILQSLLAYPVAGSQLTLGAILLTLCGAICLADGGSELVAFNRERPSADPIAANALTALFVVLALGTTSEYIVQPIETYHDVYRANTPLEIDNATRLRLPAATAVDLETVVGALRAHCRTVISLPGLYLFNVWTGLPSPSPITGAGSYWHTLTSAQQSTVLAAAKASPGLCAVRDDALAAMYGQGATPPRVPLVAFIEDDFKPLAVLGPYVVETRRP
jgi:hypothetical protein